MANQSIGLSEALYQYLLAHSLHESEALQLLRAVTESQELSQMRSSPEQGQLMAMLLRLIGARSVIEVGTYTGYATLWMAEALPDDGEIITCDISESWTAVALEHWQKAGLAEKISLQLAPASDTLDTLLDKGRAEQFDFAFIDADKESYPAYFERCLKLLRSGGLMVIDNVLWGGSVIDAENSTSATMAIRAFNKSLYNDDRIEISMLPVGDGITLARKR